MTKSQRKAHKLGNQTRKQNLIKKWYGSEQLFRNVMSGLPQTKSVKK